MRRSSSTATLLTVALFVAACSSGDATPAATSSPEVVTSLPPTTTETTVPPEVDTALPISDEAVAGLDAAYASFQDAYEANDYRLTPDIALGEFDLAYGTSIAGVEPEALSAQVDGGEALRRIDSIWDDLTTEQQDAVVARVRVEFENTTPGGSVDDLVDLEAEFVEEFGAAEPEGMRRQSGLRGPATAPTLADPFDDLDRIFARAHVYLRSKLGGPPLDFEWSFGDIADADPGERGRTSIWAVHARPGTLGGALDDIFDRTCPMTMYRFPGTSQEYLEAIVVHELFHCWSWTNGDRTGYVATPAWFQEGVAVWIGAQYSGGSALGRGWWNAFAGRETFSLYRESYAAFGFWSQLAELIGGSDELWSRIPGFNTSAGIGDDGNLFEFVTAGIDRRTLATLASSGLQQPAFGGDWEVSGASVTTSGRAPVPVTVSRSNGEREVIPFARQRLVQFQIDGSLLENPWILRVSTSGLVSTRWQSGDEIVFVEDQLSNYCIGDECLCPDGSLPYSGVERLPADAGSMTAALTGRSADGAAIEVKIIELTNDCEEPEPEPADLGDGDTGDVVGTYRASGEAIAQMFRETSIFGGGEALDIAGASGDLLMTLSPDGTGTLKYIGVNIVFSDGPLGALTIDGGGTFTYGVGDTFRVDGLDYTLSVYADALGPDPLTIGSADLPGGSGFSEFTYGFADGRLILESLGGTSGEVFFPRVWFKE